MPTKTAAAAARAAVRVAARLGVACTEPGVLADGANVIVHLSPSPVVAKVAASTVEVRADPGAWLQRELDVARWLHGAAIPVADPSPEVPATVHHGDGWAMSFWRYRPPAGGRQPDEGTFGSMLRDMHLALRDYPGTPPVLAPLQDIPAYLARPRTRISQEGKAALTAAFRRLTAELDPQAVTQVLHGDAGMGNVTPTTAGGWIWHDFEDTCAGPVAWDLAASTANPRLAAARILAGYGAPVDAGQLAVCEQLRRLHLTVWYNLYAERLPELRPRAAELLAQWPRSRQWPQT
jgi:Ser/Thr protein kinase RdoA (MazF antagonist)